MAKDDSNSLLSVGFPSLHRFYDGFEIVSWKFTFGGGDHARHKTDGPAGTMF